MRHILVATDGSEAAGRAIDFAAALAGASGGTLTIVTAGRARQSEDDIQFTQVEGDVANAAESFARRTLADAEERARRAGIAAPKTHLAWGDPTREIIGLVQAEKPDALVIGRRGHGRLAGLLLGSVSQKLVTLASCPVIVVP